MKEEISDQKFATVVLNHAKTISSLNAQKLEDLKWENAKSLLIDEYVKQKEKQTESPGQNDALFSRKSNHGYSSHGRNQSFMVAEGYNSNLRDHAGQNQRKSNQPSQMQGVNVSNVKNLTTLSKTVLNKRLNKSNITEEGKQVQSGNDGIAITSTPVKEGNYQWFIDSRAIKHMTF